MILINMCITQNMYEFTQAKSTIKYINIFTSTEPVCKLVEHN